jgi:hypothetical protein
MLQMDCCVVSTVVKDKNLEVYYDVLLTKIDAKVGQWGLYNFYKMQVSNVLYSFTLILSACISYSLTCVFFV